CVVSVVLHVTSSSLVCASPLTALSSRCACPSFPTRRSSDLVRQRSRGGLRAGPRTAGHRRAHPRERRQPMSHFSVRTSGAVAEQDRKSTRLNSSHVKISYAVFCLKKKSDISAHRAHVGRCSA